MSWNTRIFSRMISYSNEIISADNYTIGIERVARGGKTGTWRYIDSSGSTVKLPTEYFDYHPIFSGMKNVEIDGQVMISLPKFYVKQVFSTYRNSDVINSYKIWITYINPDDSDAETTIKQQGFHLHPAFYCNGSKISGDKIYIGAYQASLDDNNKACSIGSTRDTANVIIDDGGKYPSTNRSFNYWLDACKARNEEGSDDVVWHMMTIYEYSALQLLFLIENCTTDTQKLYSYGNCNSNGLVYVDEDNTESNPIYHGINSLWGNASQLVDGIFVDENNLINVFDSTGNTASNYFKKNFDGYTNTGKLAYSKSSADVSAYSSTQWRYFSDVYIDDILANLFIPDANKIVESSKLATYSDGIYPTVYTLEDNTKHFCTVGGDYTSDEYGGLFCIRMNISGGNTDDYSENRTNNLSSCTTRLCKY